MGLRLDANRTDTPALRIAIAGLWTEEQFESSCKQWTDLLSRSNADPLFMSWEWQWLWWKHHRDLPGAQLYVIAAYDPTGLLVGLAPLYLHRAMHRGLGASRLESIGSNFRDTGYVFSEYLDLIIDRKFEKPFLNAVADFINSDGRWNDLVFSNTPKDGHASKLVNEHLKQQYVRIADPLFSYSAQIPQSFDSYLHTLDADTRRRSWNHRKKLISPVLVDVPTEQIDDTLSLLDRFHKVRWGQAHYVGTRRLFNRAFAQSMAKLGALRMTELRSADAPISVMYNVRLGGTEYNIQSGFDAAQSKGISPGYLHFGYALERACEHGIKTFDFLAGKGLHRDYKRDFSTQPRALVTLQSVRARALAWLYKEYDKRFLRSLGMLAPPVGLLADALVCLDSISDSTAVLY